MLTVDFNKLRIRSGDRLLDIGCGTGRHAAAAVALNGVRVFAGDLKEPDLLKARDRLRFHDAVGASADNGAWALFSGDIRSLPLKSECMDCVICSEVLEHVRDHDRAIAELYRIIKPGGQLVVSVPRFYPEAICWRLSADYPDPDGGGHLRIYRFTELARLLICGGFRINGHHHAHSLHTPYWWLKCLVGPRRQDHRLVGLYHRFLVWDILSNPWVVRFIDRLCNPILGKSLVVYAIKLPIAPR